MGGKNETTEARDVRARTDFEDGGRSRTLQPLVPPMKAGRTGPVNGPIRTGLNLKVADKFLNEFLDFALRLPEGGNDVVPIVLKHVADARSVLHVEF